MARGIRLAAFFILLILPIDAFCQSGTLSGTITDTKGAVLPGVTVTVMNGDNRIETSARSNASGTYSLPGLQPGVYELTAVLSGFETQYLVDVTIPASGQVRLNVTLELPKKEQQENSDLGEGVSAKDMAIDTAASTATAFSGLLLSDLPTTNDDILGLTRAVSGILPTDGNPVLTADGTRVAGVQASNINVQRDGVTINDVRYPTGLNAPVHLNTDFVNEFRVVLSPGDAEAGRGSGQVQVVTRSGGSEHHGSLVWNLRNSALDANEFHHNRTSTPADWRNIHDYAISYGGPLIKDKTYFFMLWNQQLASQRTTVNTPVLTPCARKGIFRYYDNWMSTNTMGTETATGTMPTRIAVDSDGTPIAPDINPNGTAFKGKLRSYYMFGRLLSPPEEDDCSDFSASSDVASGTYWDTYRRKPDSSGYINRFTEKMPQANNYEIGDGLNTAGHKWNRTTEGSDNIFGLGDDDRRKQFNIRIDHFLNAKHRISGSYTYERSSSEDNFASWSNGFGGAIVRKPQLGMASIASSIRPNLFNEFRFGISRTNGVSYDPLDNPDTGSNMKSLLQTLLSTSSYDDYEDLPIVVSPGSGRMAFSIDTTRHAASSGIMPSNPVGSNGQLPYTFGGHDTRITFGDALAWTRGRHTLTAGGEFRMWQSYQQRNGTGSSNVYVSAFGGSTSYTPVQGINSNRMPGIVGAPGSFGSVVDMENMLNYFAGSLSSMSQMVYLHDPTSLEWNNYLEGEDRQVFDIRGYEWDAFLKDDWKVTKDFTLNIGLRYQYYGVPFVNSGMTVGLEGGAASLFGISERGFDKWLKADQTSAGDLTKQIFVGRNSENPDLNVYNKDWNDFGPAVGFAWNLPWFGKGQTVLRGGYQLSYMPIGRASDFATVFANTAGTSYTHVYSGDSGHPYLDLAHMSTYIPLDLPAGVLPMATIPLTARNQSFSAYEDTIRNPYVQNMTLGVTRSFGSDVTLDVRYIGTLGRKQIGSVNLNTPNFLTNGLKEAFDLARTGQESALLDQMFKGINIQGSGACGAVGKTCNGILQTGAMQLRGSQMLGSSGTTLQSMLANGQYAALADTLALANYSRSYPGNSGLPNIAGGVNGAILRYNSFPENFIYTNPQFSSANLLGNLNYNNYHSLQAQVTVRPSNGFTFVGSYTWSRNLGLTDSYTDPLDRAADYSLVNSNRSHQFVTYGSLELPIGKDRLLLKDIPKLANAIVGGWQLSWIGSFASGTPNSIEAAQTLYSNGTPDFVGPKGSFDPKTGEVSWETGASSGNYFGDKYIKVADPQCGWISEAQGLRSACSLQAIALASNPNSIVLQNAMPGTRGNFGRNNLSNAGLWSFDASMSKLFRLSESKSFLFRVDAANLFNHPQPSLGYISVSGLSPVAGNPDFNLNNSNPFGYLDNKVGTRSFRARLRFDF